MEFGLKQLKEEIDYERSIIQERFHNRVSIENSTVDPNWVYSFHMSIRYSESCTSSYFPFQSILIYLEDTNSNEDLPNRTKHIPSKPSSRSSDKKRNSGSSKVRYLYLIYTFFYLGQCLSIHIFRRSKTFIWRWMRNFCSICSNRGSVQHVDMRSIENASKCLAFKIRKWLEWISLRNSSDTTVDVE